MVLPGSAPTRSAEAVHVTPPSSPCASSSAPLCLSRSPSQRQSARSPASLEIHQLVVSPPLLISVSTPRIQPRPDPFGSAAATLLTLVTPSRSLTASTPCSTVMPTGLLHPVFGLELRPVSGFPAPDHNVTRPPVAFPATLHPSKNSPHPQPYCVSAADCPPEVPLGFPRFPHGEPPLTA